jgi:hypothetical protein
VSRSLAGFAVVLVVISAPFLAWGAYDRWYYLSTEEIAAELPTYPGAVLLTSDSEYLAYRLPGATPRENVRRFYLRAMPESWSRPDRDCEGFTRRGGLVMAGVDVFDRRLLKVLIERKGGGDCADYSSFLHS